jgi:hypothetical protein
MSSQAKRSIYNSITFDADYVDFHGTGSHSHDVHLSTGEDAAKLLFESDTQVIPGKKLLVSQVCDKDGAEIFSKDETNGRIKFNIPIDLNNQALVNNPGGSGGGATTTSGIQSENLPGQTLENELDAITAAGLAQATDITNLQTTQGTQATDITNLQTTQGTQATAITTLQTTQATQGTNITNLQTTQGTQATDITNLQTTQGTQGTDITALQTQQTLNIAAIASNTARTSNLTADRILISSAVGTINTAGIGVGDVATKFSSNTFNAPLGNPATNNIFDTVSASTVNNTGTTESAAYTQGGAALNFSHLAGSATNTQIPTTVMRTDLADQTIQGTPGSSALTKLTVDNTHTSGNSQIVIQKRTTGGVLEGGLTIQQTTTGSNITASGSNTANISITPASGLLAMTIGSTESRFHNALKILGSLSGAARSDNKDYIFKTIGATGVGDVLLLEDVLQRPKTGNPALGFNPAQNSLIEYDTAGAPTYKDTSNFLQKPGNANPAFQSFVAVNTGGSFSYVSNAFAPLPGAAFPTSGEKVIMMNPGGSSYLAKEDLILRPGNANPTSGTKLITINNVGTRAYKDVNQFLTTPGGANPSTDSFIKISSTGVQSYVAESSLGGGGIQKPGGNNPGQQSLISLDTAGNETYLAESNLIKTNIASQTIESSASATSLLINCSSTTLADECSLKIERSGGVGDNHIEFIPKRGTFAEWHCKNDLRIIINGGTKMGVGNHSVDFFKPLVMQNGQDIRMNQTFTAPANSSSTGGAGTIGFDSTHLYIAVGTNSWKRVALSTF